MALGINQQIRIGPWQVMGNIARLSDHFDHRITGIITHLVIDGINIIPVPDERFIQVNRIINDHGPGQHVVMPNKIFGYCGLITASNPVAAQPAFLEMSGFNF